MDTAATYITRVVHASNVFGMPTAAATGQQGIFSVTSLVFSSGDGVKGMSLVVVFGVVVKGMSLVVVSGVVKGMSLFVVSGVVVKGMSLIVVSGVVVKVVLSTLHPALYAKSHV